MISVVEQNRKEVAKLCQQYNVTKLELFGSAADASRFDPQESDVDLLVEFAHTEAMNRADQFFGLKGDLEDLFGRQIDLITTRSLRNPYFIRSINATREALYAT